MRTVFAYLDSMAQIDALVEFERLTVWGGRGFFMKEASAHTRHVIRAVGLTGSQRAPPEH